jgi:hypothetical protein
LAEKNEKRSRSTNGFTPFTCDKSAIDSMEVDASFNFRRTASEIRSGYPIKTPEELQIIDRIPFSEIGLKLFRKPFQERLSITGPLFPPLFFFDNLPSDEPVRHHLGGIDRSGSASAGRLQNLPDSAIKRLRGFGFFMGSFHFS